MSKMRGDFEAAAKIPPAITPPGGNLWRRAVVVSIFGFLAVASAGLYANTFQSRPAVPPLAGAGTASTPAAGASDVDGNIEGLALRLQQNPADAEGWRMLGWSYFNTGRYGEAAAAYAKAAALRPDNNDFQSSYAEALVQAAGGQVAPELRKIFEAVLARDPAELRSRFYMALAREQAGELERALKLWMALVADAPAGAGWVADVNTRIAGIKARTAGLPQAKPESSVALAAKDHQSTTDGMIASLAARLENNPHDRDGWVMMIRSRSVMGDMAGARDALARARSIFAGDAATLNKIEAVAGSLGVSDSPMDALRPEDIAAVTALPEPDQKAMIRGMVEGLAERLAASPHDAEGWIRLIRSRVVLNEPDLARETLRLALAEFASDAEATMKISEAARGLGLMFD